MWGGGTGTALAPACRQRRVLPGLPAARRGCAGTWQPGVLASAWSLAFGKVAKLRRASAVKAGVTLLDCAWS